MATKQSTPAVRVLAEDVANKIAAGEVVERPASVVKELVENALDAQATRISVRIVGAGRRLIEVTDNGHGMSEQDALLAIERHATSKIRQAKDLDNIASLGFRGEALPSIASVSRFELLTRRAQDEAGTSIRIDGGVLRDVGEAPAPQGTRVSVHRLYFNTPARAKFLKGITTELSHCIDVVQRHALAHPGVGFQLTHNEKVLLDIPEASSLRDRIALIWGLRFVEDMVPLDAEAAGMRFHGYLGSPALTRSSRSHQFFFVNQRPIVNRTLQFGLEEGFQGLLTVGRHPVGVVLIDAQPKHVDINVHPSKREARFRDERALRTAIRDVTRAALEAVDDRALHAADRAPEPEPAPQPAPQPAPAPEPGPAPSAEATPSVPNNVTPFRAPSPPSPESHPDRQPAAASYSPSYVAQPEPEADAGTQQTEFEVQGMAPAADPDAVYRPVGDLNSVAMQLFDTYLLVPDEDRLLIIDQHALHERLNFDRLVRELNDSDYASQQLAVPILIDVPPASGRLIEANSDLFAKLGIELESFGGNTYQITAICPLYDENEVPDAVYRILDELSQGNLFDRQDFLSDLLRLATEACRASVKAGDRLTEQEKHELVEGFRRMRPPYTCPHGRPIITELTLSQMERSFRRRQ